MVPRLVTIATFANPFEANIARNQLAADGIDAYLGDETTVGTAWHLGLAVGGIKLQVASTDAVRARDLLDAARAEARTDTWSDEHPDDWGEGLADVTEATDDETLNEDEEPDEHGEDQTESLADQTASRALRAAILGLILLPLQYYSVWLLLRLAFRGDGLTATGLRRVGLAMLFDTVIVLLTVFLLSSLNAR